MNPDACPACGSAPGECLCALFDADDPDRPSRWRDGDDDLRPLDDEVGFPFDEYDLRPAPDGADF